MDQIDPPRQTANICEQFNAFETFCFPQCIIVTVHTAGRNTVKSIKLKLTVFNINKAGQDKQRQTHMNTGSNE